MCTLIRWKEVFVLLGTTPRFADIFEEIINQMDTNKFDGKFFEINLYLKMIMAVGGSENPGGAQCDKQ